MVTPSASRLADRLRMIDFMMGVPFR
jgi:hypothetical protein